MTGWRRALVCGLAMSAAAGCAWGRKPYAGDPLIRGQLAVWGDREKARTIPDEPLVEPAIPAAPNLELVGAPR